MTRTILSNHGIAKAWWKSAVVYQIYPSSFCDSNGDGLGDLTGIIGKIDYLKSLGVDVVWLSPIFESPQVDMGYDISDYKAIHAPYGSVADVERLINGLHSRGMKLLLDLVVNHTSDEHPWFIDSRRSKDSSKRDWYIWRPPIYDENGRRKPPNNWKTSLGGGSVWEWDESTEEYYLHYYDIKQPDLNFENPDVREAVYDIMRFWLDKGCDGFRMDVIGRISKDLSFPDAPITDHSSQWQDTPRIEGPRVHEFLQEMNREVLSNYDIMTVGELSQTSREQMLRFVHPERKELQMGFCFDHVNLGRGGVDNAMVSPWTLPQFKAIIAEWQGLRDEGGWHALYLENHDQPRSVSRFANDSPKWRGTSAKMLAMMHTTLCGTVYLYQGQEIGMINLPDDWPLEEWKDVKTQNVVAKIRESGRDVEDLTRKVYFKARDNGRSPMQWDDSPYGGFSTVEPWMRVPEDHKYCNVARQIKEGDSVLAFWKEMLALRKDLDDALIYGTFEHLSPEDERIFAYTRAGTVMVVLNFSEEDVSYSVPRNLERAKLIKSTLPGAAKMSGSTISLRPYSGVIYVLCARGGQDLLSGA